MHKVCACSLNVKPKFDDISIVHDVLLALHTEFALGFGFGH